MLAHTKAVMLQCHRIDVDFLPFVPRVLLSPDQIRLEIVYACERAELHH